MNSLGPIHAPVVQAPDASPIGPSAPGAHDPVHQLADALRSVDSPDSESADEATLHVAQTIFDALVGDTLHLERLDEVTLHRLETMPAKGWSVLAGATSVTLPVRPGSAGMPERPGKLVEKLSALPALRAMTLTMTGEQGMQLDLSSIQCESIRVQPSDEGAISGLHLTVRSGVKVVAVGASRPGLLKSTVRHLQQDGSPGKPVALFGNSYFRRPSDFMEGKQSPDSMLEAARNAWYENINGQAYMALPEGARMSEKDRRIVCRHLSMLWLKERAQSRSDRKEEPGRFSFNRMMSVSSLQKLVCPESAEAAYGEVLGRQADAVFKFDQFGHAIAHAFKSMGDGSLRPMLAVTHDHVMGVELQRKGNQYILAFYDPNSMVLSRTIGESPDWFAEQDNAETPLLQKLLMKPDEKASRATTYSTNGNCFGTLVACPQLEEASAAPPFFASDAKGSPAFVEWALKASSAGLVSEGLEALSQRGWNVEESALRLGDGFREAMKYSGPDALAAATAYMKKVLDAKVPLEPEDRFRLLSAPIRTDEFDPTSVCGAALQLAMDHGNVDAVRTYTRLVADADRKLLPRKLDLLTAARASYGIPHPMLYDMSAGNDELPHLAPELRPRQHLAIHAFVSEILQSSTLSDDEKIQLCVGSRSFGSAAETAIKGRNAGAAGAILCAIIEHTREPFTTTLLKQVYRAGEMPGAEQTLAALRDSERGGSPASSELTKANEHWATKIQEWLGAKSSAVRGRDESVPGISQRSPIIDSKAATPGAEVHLADMTEEVNRICKSRSLQVVAAVQLQDHSDDLHVVCIARGAPIQALEDYVKDRRVLEAMPGMAERIDAAKKGPEFGMYSAQFYLVPIAMLDVSEPPAKKARTGSAPQ